METTAKPEPQWRKDAKIMWYRCEVDPKVMSQLMKCSDWKGLRHVLAHLGLWVVTGTVAYLNFTNVHAGNRYWSVPLLLASLFLHGTVGNFLGGTACHELGHKTPFKTKSLNDFFLRIFAFLGWWDYVWFRPSHVRHHQVTLHHEHDGEVVAHQLFTFDWKFWLWLLGWNPIGTWQMLRTYYRRATGRMDNAWYEYLMPEENAKVRREHRNWARFTLIGHAALAAIFIATGHWFLIVLVSFSTQYAACLSFLCGAPQHHGLCEDVPDHRLSCRTYTSTWLPSFLYWNMQYHVEHHMFPAVPFYNLPKLRKAIEHDMPKAHHGLLPLWRELHEIHLRQKKDKMYVHTPVLPQSQPSGTRANDRLLESEAAMTI